MQNLLNYGLSLFEPELRQAAVDLKAEAERIGQLSFYSPEERQSGIDSAEKLHRINTAVRFEATDKHTGESLEGQSGELFGELGNSDPAAEKPQGLKFQDLQDLRIYLPILRTGHSLSLHLLTTGVAVTAEGPLVWAEGVKAGFEAELRRRRPWWWFLLWQYGAASFTALYIIVSYVIVQPFITDTATLLQRTLLMNIIPLAIMLLFARFNRTLLPRCEFLKPDAKSIGTKWLMWLLAGIGIAAINAVVRAIER